MKALLSLYNNNRNITIVSDQLAADYLAYEVEVHAQRMHLKTLSYVLSLINRELSI